MEFFFVAENHCGSRNFFGHLPLSTILINVTDNQYPEEKRQIRTPNFYV